MALELALLASHLPRCSERNLVEGRVYWLTIVPLMQYRRPIREAWSVESTGTIAIMIKHSEIRQNNYRMKRWEWSLCFRV
jgi:hypothetical protein